MPAELDYEYKTQPYCTEYARTGASTCRECKGSISESSLRMGTRFPSRKHEGMQESWFHFNCFWRKPRKTISESRIYGIDKLEETDRKRIKSHLKRYSSEDVVAPGSVDEQDKPLPKGVKKRRGQYRATGTPGTPKKSREGVAGGSAKGGRARGRPRGRSAAAK
ncbi:poly(ADP-ribose) polymerase and DNA-Ligase zn-finger region domain-containing protein [Ditylenchus destructor]|uniref:Poly(ADP-ribose) polymerase and DNA-Ligase zn-finger region domain-containing protein n=1 Tax=Ditylenchus destructor TaxID=166010 RepID=A0AAD4RAV1_9BILA|nr:poly(ADP-ribose) polymerase and DNA-Ligase zn-finger region domain-containing protein [Ditylenchus destructor]